MSCGIEEYYYLPQIPEVNINVQFNTNAIIEIPAISTTTFYYASGYSIFYRIYLSAEPAGSSENKSAVNPSLLEDFNFFYPYTDPSNYTLITSANTFSSRGYFELDYIIDIDDKRLDISFSPGTPEIVLDNVSQPIKRSRDVRNNNPQVTESFMNTAELCKNENAVSTYNADTAPIRNAQPLFAYTAMYFVTVGMNPETFNRIYSKPTFIGVFILPNE